MLFFLAPGKEIKRVKPRRTTSFFGRQLSNAPTSYSAVRAAENLEQGWSQFCSWDRKRDQTTLGQGDSKASIILDSVFGVICCLPLISNSPLSISLQCQVSFLSSALQGLVAVRMYQAILYPDVEFVPGMPQSCRSLCLHSVTINSCFPQDSFGHELSSSIADFFLLLYDFSEGGKKEIISQSSSCLWIPVFVAQTFGTRLRLREGRRPRCSGRQNDKITPFSFCHVLYNLRSGEGLFIPL